MNGREEEDEKKKKHDRRQIWVKREMKSDEARRGAKGDY